MSKKRTIVIPPDVKCSECGSDNLRGAGTDFKRNINLHCVDGIIPTRILVQRYICMGCGKTFTDYKRRPVAKKAKEVEG